MPTPIPTASLGDTLAIAAEVLAPTLAKGPIIRRPRMVALAERHALDRRAVRRMQRVRDRYGPGPLRLRVPGIDRALVLDPADVHRVLDASPEPFATASTEKRAALAHFQPAGVLVSHGAARAERRTFNERVLESDRPQHRHADRFAVVVAEEADRILANARRQGALSYGGFADGWFRLVRRVTFGDAAREDHALRAMVDALRRDANWAFLHPQDAALRERFLARVREHLARAEPGSLASMAAATPQSPVTAPEHQVGQWLFAFDPAGMTTVRALALLAAHPEAMARARAELRAQAGAPAPHLPFLRATVLESLRLWPTTPLVLRETTTETAWETGTMPAGTGVLIYAPFFHRDGTRLPEADRFAPELWLAPRDPKGWPLIPFSGGPAICPARHLVLYLASAMLAALLGERRVRLTQPERLDASRPLPGTLDPYTLLFLVDG